MENLSVDDQERLIKAAFEAKNGSYSPYSKFRVGAALLSSTGDVIKGANVENASYGGAICAERTAIVKAVSEGVRNFVAMAVTTDVAAPLSPCGMCRQVMREFCALDMPIVMAPSDYFKSRSDGVAGGEFKVMTIGELLPESFGPEQLELPRS